MSENNNEALQAALNASQKEANARKKEQNELNAVLKASTNSAAAEEKLRASKEQTEKNIENMGVKEATEQSKKTKQTYNTLEVKRRFQEQRNYENAIEESLKPALPSALPSGWIELKTPEGEIYYENESEGITQWEKPTNSASASSATTESTLPANWQAVIDPGTGKTYYYNSHTQETTWDIPTAGGSRKKRQTRNRRANRKRSSRHKSRR